MAFKKCNGINIFYEIHGTGTPLILISGLGGDHFFWQPGLAFLSDRYQVITFDTRGIGQTDAPQQPYSMDIFVADLLALMDELEIKKAHILGFSMGGNIALSFALKHPHRIMKLIIAASHATPAPQIQFFIDAVLDVYEKGISTKQMFNLVCPWLFSNRFLSDPANAAFLQFDENDPYPQPVYAWKNQYLAQREYNVVEQLSHIKLHTLVLCAEHDPFAPLDASKLLHDNIENSVLKIVADSGHLMNYEFPEIFHRHVVEFLEE
jgi:3-oxoadipate enol-lactonase